MRIKIKAFGEARKHLPDYEPKAGIDLELPSGLIIKDLLVHLNIQSDKGLAVSMNGLIVGPDMEVSDGATIVLLNPLSGG